MELVGIEAAITLHDPPFHPVDTPRLPVGRSIFHSIRDAGSLLLMHPYESFAGTVERFLREASHDPKVRAIKMTLYRTSRDARIVGYLQEAARNGKQVAAVIELKARFDEAANIAFAEQLEAAGIHVSYGVVGLKTHCKLILVVRQDYDGLRRYVHLSTGNYHPETARIYADIGPLDGRPVDRAGRQRIVQLPDHRLRAWTRLRQTPAWPGLVEAGPAGAHRARARARRRGLIQFKMNALEDADITRALYRAARAGVQVDLVIRDTCRLRPGIAGLSERVRVVSIVGRFLEHARVYYFRNAGAEEFFIGSADSMKRNLEGRVEVLAPVEDVLGRQALRAMLDLQLAPNRNQWRMQPDGEYVRSMDAATHDRGCQQALLEWIAHRESAPAPPSRRRSVKRFASRAAATPA